MNDLRELLHAAVPEPPAVPDRADAARDLHRRQRRRTTYAVTAATAAVVAVLALVPALLSSDDPARPEPAPAPAEGCPPPGSPADGADKLRDDPVEVRLCPGTSTSFDAPLDALVTNTQTVVALANTQPGATGDAGCGPGNAYLLVFAYADWHRQVVPVAEDCGLLRLGDTLRENGDAAVAKYLEHLREQRAATEPPPGLATAPDCGTTPAEVSPIGRPAEMVTGVLCSGALSIPVPAADLAVLLDDAVPEEHGSPDPPDVTLVGTTAWGDTTMATAGTDWWPGPEALQVLDRLVAEAGTPDATLDSSSTPAEVVSAYVGRLNAGDAAGADALWMSLVPIPQTPHTASYVGADIRKVRSMPFVSAWRDATAVTTRYREVLRDGSGADYRTVVFVLGRDENGAFRIVSMGR